MRVNKFCTCCNSISEFYQHPTGRTQKYCKKCNKNYNKKQRKQREFNNVLGIINNVQNNIICSKQ